MIDDIIKIAEDIMNGLKAKAIFENENSYIITFYHEDLLLSGIPDVEISKNTKKAKIIPYMSKSTKEKNKKQ